MTTDVSFKSLWHFKIQCNLPISAWIMTWFNGRWPLLFFSFPMAQLAARVSLLKNISIEALIYPGQLLNAEQYAHWCEYQYTPDPSITSTICKIKPTTVLQSIVSYISVKFKPPHHPLPSTFDVLFFQGKQRTISFRCKWLGWKRLDCNLKKVSHYFQVLLSYFKKCKTIYLVVLVCSFFKDHITL